MEAPEILETPDRSLATTALVEGDATAIMTLYTQAVAARNPFAVLGMLVEGLQAGNLFLPPGIPPILTQELLFPYEGGMDFVVALYNDGGWDAVNAAFANPPTTSEQIYHPEKYLAGEGAQEVALGDKSRALGDDWSAAWNTTLGEFYLRAHLATELSSSAAASAASGWGGDHFIVYQNGDQLAWALRIVWDTPTDRSEFYDFYYDYANARSGTPMDNDCWQDADGTLCLFTTAAAGQDTLIAFAPSREQARALFTG
jgi:hypothetical protein